MRRESSTVIALVGAVSGQLLDGLASTPNVSVVRAPGAAADPSVQAADARAAAQPGWEPGAQAMREAVRRRSTYVIVAETQHAGLSRSFG